MADDFKDLINEKRLKRFKDFLDGLFGHLARHALTADTDLNTVTNAGVYYCNDDSTAKTITNKPYERAFWMVVGGISKSISQHYPIQILIPWGFSRFYVRHSANGGAGWSDWVRLATIEEIEKYLGDINDFTTGINLIRGSRDFKAGTELYIQNIYLDGFHSTNEVTYEKDANGFAIAKMQAASSVRSMLGTGVKTELKAGEPITFSFDVMFLEKSGGNVQIGEIRLVNKSGSLLSSETKAISVTAAGLDSANIENNTWYRAVYHCSFGQDINPDEYVLWVFVVSPNASNVAFRKVALNYGNIQHPIWSPSPFDYVLAPINDITMKQNLVIGSKDFKKGTKNNVLTGYSDGFNLVPGSKIDGIDDDGFAILTLENSTTGDKDVYASSNRIPIDNPGDTYTFMFDVRFNEIESLSKYRLFTVVPMNASNASVGQYSWNSSELHLDNAEIGKWYTCCITHTVTTAAVQFFVRPSILKPGSVSYRKVCVYKGRIQNPVWNFNPQDLVTTPVDAEKLGLNDLTTGINLARGSRDFIIGSELFGSTIFPLDGFENRGNYTFSKDDEGFTVASKSQTGLSATADKQIGVLANHKFKAGENVTVSFEFMIDDVEAFDNWRILYVVTQSSTGTSRNGGYFDIDRVCETNHTDLESGVWYKAKYHRLFTEDLADDERLRITLLITQNGSINFRKLMIQEGVINNPIWAPSPFDVATNVNDITYGENILKGSRDFVSYLHNFNLNSNLGDGFRDVAPWTLSKDDDGFTVASMTKDNSWTVSHNIFSEPITDIKPGDQFTGYVEIKTDDVTPFVNGSFATAGLLIYKGTSSFDTSSNVRASAIADDLKSGDWVKVLIHYTIPSNIDDTCYLFFQLHHEKNTTVSFRKACIYRGYINNPTWAPSPADLSLNANDMTTGINLLRGTRDFIRGTEQVISGNSIFYKNGFACNSWTSPTFYQDNDGFTVAKIAKEANATEVYFNSSPVSVSLNDELTFSFEVMVDDIENYGFSNFCAVFQTNNASSVASKMYTLNDFVNNPESEKWYKITIPTAISANNANYCYMRLLISTSSRGSINFRKVNCQRGRVVNPIWSANPFDVAQQSELNETPKLLGKLNADREIPASSNLNDIIIPGTYFNDLGTDVRTITNTPENARGDAFVMDVSYALGTAYAIRQDFRYYNSPIMYTRWGIQSGSTYNWQPWYHDFSSAKTVNEARANLLVDRKIAVNPIASIEEDTLDKWLSLENGWYNITVDGRVHGQPHRYCNIFNYTYDGTDVEQLLITSKGTNSVMMFRSYATAYAVSDKNDARTMPAFVPINNGFVNIPENADLDTYVQTGTYKVSTDAIANTISNRPSTSIHAFFLHVMNLQDGNNWCFQIAYDYFANAYMRGRTSSTANTWTAWRKIFNSADAVTTADIDKMFAGTYKTGTSAKVVDDAAIDYAIQKLKEL